MGGGRGPPTGELMRGTPGKGGGPFAATVTLPSSITLVGEELLELLFITGAAPDPGSAEAEGFPDASDDHRGRGRGPSTDPNSPLGISLLSVAERGLAGGSAVGGGEHSPPLTGDGPKEPFWLGGPRHGGFWVVGLPGLGFTITGSSCSMAIFWVNSSNLEYGERMDLNMKYNLRALGDTKQHCLWKPERTGKLEFQTTYLCLKLAASLFSSAIALSAARALSCGRQTSQSVVADYTRNKGKKKTILPSYHELSSHE